LSGLSIILALSFLSSAFFIFLLTCFLRLGVVGSYGGDLQRDKKPIAYWTSIAAIVVAAAVATCVFLFTVWTELHD
jgi:hypothetical protein